LPSWANALYLRLDHSDYGLLFVACDRLRSQDV